MQANQLVIARGINSTSGAGIATVLTKAGIKDSQIDDLPEPFQAPESGDISFGKAENPDTCRLAIVYFRLERELSSLVDQAQKEKGLEQKHMFSNQAKEVFSAILHVGGLLHSSYIQELELEKVVELASSGLIPKFCQGWQVVLTPRRTFTLEIIPTKNGGE